MKESTANADLEFLTELRHELHAHPELGFEEVRTSARVLEYLEAAGITVNTGLAGTGLVASITAGDGKGSIGLRADMDALAMTEVAERPYQSKVAGKMHACGHDGHTVMLLGAALELARSRRFSGTVHCIFQPAEEGRGGARRMVEEGLFKQFPCDLVFGLHNMPGLAVDEMAVVVGPQLASSDSWRVVFEGVGTHGAKPHLGRDAITASGHFLSALQTIPGRVVDPLEPAVVSACSVQAGDPEALNVIPDKVHIGGTARAYTPQVRDQLEQSIGQLAQGIADTFGIRAHYEYIRRIPPVVNNAAATALALQAAKTVCGAAVRTDFPRSTAGDDFSFFSQDIPGCYVWLGNGPAVDGALHHNTSYDFNDGAIRTGMNYWVTLAEQVLPT
ncbi:M20 aminoacylase family protein [Granulosicoccus antarcticus]|uniref:Putative hydrolase YxeP n=1 Tax=Granulosicoccus antarcticus IMCC3135 TaxID=1192854 RepID=A0A2Z2NSC4_9GAMM|nr:M20 aminoacylase family protein [Granulosicoccus antarcticus]ASJ74179.1 putative hydrolase YxeP [Granulosicoccus antarcticus IMCC3135]